MNPGEVTPGHHAIQSPVSSGAGSAQSTNRWSRVPVWHCHILGAPKSTT